MNKIMKVSICLLCFMIFWQMSVSVGANDLTIYYNQPNEYVISIPKLIDVSNGKVEEEIKIDQANIEAGKCVYLRIVDGIDSQGNMYLTRKGDSYTKIQTKITHQNMSSGIPLNTVFKTFTGKDQTTITFSDCMTLDSQPIKAGDYQGNLVFEYGITNI